MKLAVDVHYDGDAAATAAGIGFSDWTSDRIDGIWTGRIDDVRPYRPGHFYERELPCILTLIEAIGHEPDTIVVDGFVTLGAERRDGLGAHLHRALGARVPVIGVAKNRFAGTPPETEVFRGTSKHPLFVTSAGMDEAEARRLIREMHGPHRIPTLLAAVDRACRRAEG